MADKPADVMFSSGEGYEKGTGAWTRLLAPEFVEFMQIQEGHSVLDVGLALLQVRNGGRRPKIPPLCDHIKISLLCGNRKGDVMEERGTELFCNPRSQESGEEGMLREDRVREVLARLERGEGVKRVAQELGIDRKTVKRWRRLGRWCPQTRERARPIDPFASFLSGGGQR